MRLPVFFVHGIIGHLQFPELHSHLLQGTAFSPDLFGYGVHRNAQSEQLSVVEQARHLARCIDRLAGSAMVILVAHSAGAAVAMRYARAHPNRVAAIVSAEGNLESSDAFLASRLAPMSAHAIRDWLEEARHDPGMMWRREGRRPTADGLARMREWLDHQPAQAIHAAAKAVLLDTGRAAYAKETQEVMAQVPTYLAAGAWTTPALRAPAWAAALAQELRVIDNAGHLMVLEQPEAFSQYVADVIRQVSTR